MSALAGLRVLDFSRLLPGPYATWLLADQGAEVIRVEHPRELAKQAKVFGWDKLDDTGRARQRARDMLARGKKSICLDLGDPEAQATLRKLAATVDVVVEDYRPGVLGSLGLGYAALSEINPKLVYTSLTLCGQTGPLRDKPGHDPVALALAGVLSRTGEDPDAPGLPGFAAADVVTGAHAGFATLAAVMEARATGAGRHVDVAMSDCSLVLLANLIARHEDPADIPSRGTRRADMGLWRCADGEWLVTTDMEPRYWVAFCEAMGKPDYAGWQLDAERRAEIREGLQAVFATRPRDHWLAHLEAAGTQFAPVNSLAEALAEPHFRARGMVIALDAPGGALTQAGPPVRLGAFTAPAPAVLPGTHTAEVLRGLDLTETQINALARTPAQQTGHTTPAPH
ncbi:CaiB/BaiF CoA-transferase family protein [Maritimibacter sp. UBA3975]|uniref:CaiB/BaiF CoA transferase family protein n=1 Tax=Maritimibacter sp. UBA3975 TaxID=1946833 RepID=UPI000C0A2B70|nr:CaiB/BaiF CoA-transferase family protein [Maritimibacter sp. UBA3975]MAM60251.1 carnitine dehydratase [Maritimibacter sp.]|tara:strand:- start:10338 stop:11531 length:1194 start_codon:yes stop_codon:yes gene_type:complete